MLKDQDIICISTIDWDFLWQGHQEIMSTFAANGNRVLFIENTGVRTPGLRDISRLKKRVNNWRHSTKGIRKERENLYVYSPVVLPFPYSKAARWINKRLMGAVLERWIKSVGFSKPIVWTFLPTGIALDVIDSLDPKILVYYCIDNFSASSPYAKKIKPSEDKLIERADLVFVTAKKLYDRCAPFNKNIHTFPFGVAMQVYEKAMAKKPDIPKDMASIKRPVVGYVGGVHKWLDIDLVKSLAKDHREKSFVFVGPLQIAVDELKDFKNIHFLGQKKYEELPGYVANFDACIIPYLITEYTRNVYPTKINEYLALGKPVVSSAIPEVEAFNERNDNIVYIGRTKREFSSLLGGAADEKSDEAVSRKRIDAAIAESTWRVKIEKMSDLIEKRLLEKEAQKSAHWQDKILELYRNTRHGMVKGLAAALVAYLIVFYTPIVWVLAKPLVISDQLKKSDAIVVLGGGVGESGKAGQGYEERAEYAVELYKKGYAGHIVFSSGYTHILEETLVMKALAVSLGVPEKVIILETKASNTYDSVLLTKSIADKERWGSIILLSSPYHMLRVSKVFAKEGGGIDVSYAPIPRSSFYAHDNTGFFRKKISLQQIGGIIHEYMGMVYYWWKGWI